MAKGTHEEFTRFFENPTRDSLRELIKRNYGEANHIDFKETLPDKTKLAKHFLAFANSGGGVLIIGIKDGEQCEAVGATIVDKADIHKQVQSYIPSTLSYEVLDFSFKDSEYSNIRDKSFQVILIESDDQNMPYICQKAGDNIKDNVIYIRRGTSSCEANHDEVQKIINKRIETKYSSSSILSLEEHLKQLKLLYKEIPKKNQSSVLDAILNMNTSFLSYEDNPLYPKEGYQDFIATVIEAKKSRIKQFLEL